MAAWPGAVLVLAVPPLWLAALGIAGGFALGIFVYPYLFLADIVAAESVSNKAARKTLDELFKTYPDSEAAQAGKARLASLK